MRGIKRVPEAWEYERFKLCSACDTSKPWAEFKAIRWTEQERVAGVNNVCRVCEARQMREKRANGGRARSGRDYGGRLPADPFRGWLRDQLARGEQVEVIAVRAGMRDSRRLRAVLNDGQRHVALDTVDRCLIAQGWHLDELYPYEEAEAA